VIDPQFVVVYHGQFDRLRQVVSQSANRAMTEPPDILFYENQNVFIKSYLVAACSILEAFIQDIASEYMILIQGRLNSANLPHNFVAWASDHPKASLDFKPFRGEKVKKDISDLVTPNYWKTIKVFEKIGVNLTNSGVSEFKDYITTTVEKRNNIVHHNDEASDLSFSDIVAAIEQFKAYTQCLFEAVMNDPHIYVSSSGASNSLAPT
jgi:hypothetical protein